MSLPPLDARWVLAIAAAIQAGFAFLLWRVNKRAAQASTAISKIEKARHEPDVIVDVPEPGKYELDSLEPGDKIRFAVVNQGHMDTSLRRARLTVQTLGEDGEPSFTRSEVLSGIERLPGPKPEDRRIRAGEYVTFAGTIPESDVTEALDEVDRAKLVVEPVLGSTSMYQLKPFSTQNRALRLGASQALESAGKWYEKDYGVQRRPSHDTVDDGDEPSGRIGRLLRAAAKPVGAYLFLSVVFVAVLLSGVVGDEIGGAFQSTVNQALQFHPWAGLTVLIVGWLLLGGVIIVLMGEVLEVVWRWYRWITKAAEWIEKNR